MKTMFSIAGVALLATMLLGCAKDPLRSLDDDEARLYITSHDSTANFASYNTFSVSDSVRVIEDNQLAEIAFTSFDQQLVASFVNEMEQRGYSRVGRNADPDLVVNISRIYNNQTGIIDYSLYYNDYLGYYDPYYWGAGYDYYFPFPVYGVYTVTEGGISIDMFDAMNAATNGNQLKLVWNGLIRGRGTFSSSGVSTSMDALFAQSPYLDSN